MKLLRIESYGRRSVLFVTSDGIVTATLAEHAGATVPDDEIEPLRSLLVAAVNQHVPSWGRRGEST